MTPSRNQGIAPGTPVGRVRAFLAIELPKEVQEALVAVIAELSGVAGADVKWTAAHNTHLTLHFFGSEFRERLLAASHAVRAARLPPAYPAQLGALGAFPSLENPKIVWIRLGTGHTETVSLQSTVAAVLGKLDFVLDPRPFHPHVALGRIRVSRPTFRLALRRAAQGPGLLSGADFPVQAVTLMGSRLGGPEPVYEPLERIRLDEGGRA